MVDHSGPYSILIWELKSSRSFHRMQAEQRFRELLEKYLAGSCSPEEKEIMEKWFEKGGDLNKPDIMPDRSTQAQLLARIHATQDLQVSTENPARMNMVRRLFTGWRAAAVWTGLLVSAGFAGWRTGLLKPLFNGEAHLAYRMIQTGRGEVKQFLLPDSSVIVLNANSRLEYHPDFRENRQIRLRGEALFSVAKDRAHPFSVQTNDSLATTVLGTRFNIQSYNESHETRITVISGIVAVARASQSPDTLTRSEAIRYQRASRSFTILHDVNTESVTGWIKGEWDYENLRYNDLVLLLQNHYGINLSSKRNTGQLQTGVSVNFNAKQSATGILDVFCSFAGCHFRETSPANFEIY